ncbi:transposable element Tcb2 transposase [Trichonephila clavipes]|uniref:Transposable element Tcb2 transposase n=1 Tax=Trichonephila clavipes TaxID=2585209 RepID=A0A8X6R2D2_TRICX|nr:transposable element Tcb2 transposase [Trichonephila clavipes]
MDKKISAPRNTSGILTKLGTKRVKYIGSLRSTDLHEDQTQDAHDIPVVEKTLHIVRNARVQPAPSLAAIQAHVAPSPGALSLLHPYEGTWQKDIAEWNKDVFSDESRFNLSSDDNRVRVWRPRGEHFNPAFVLHRHTAPTACDGAIFQQDNDHPHTASVSQDCLRTVTALLWPVRSLELSPIEHIWDYLGRRVGNLTSLNESEARL